MGRLTVREREIIRLVSLGLSCQQMADTLQISVNTIRKHRSNIMAKLNLHSTVQFTAYAVSDRCELYPLPEINLTPREQQVVQLITQGFTCKQIARQLGISPGTVRKHRDNITKRTGLRSIQDIIIKMILN